MGERSGSSLSGGEAVVRALEAQGVELVFGIPGTHTLPIDGHLATSTIRHVLPRHEQGAGYAADGYARATGRAGVCVVTSGPGVTNLATAAAQAWSDSVPMLIISPGMPRAVNGRDTGFLHEAKDQSRAMDNLVAWSHRAVSPADVVDTIHRAFAEFASCRPRPVHLEIPLEVLDEEAAVSLSPPPPANRPRVSDAAVRNALDILATARRPGLLVGGGAQGAAPQVRQLAHALDAIVITSTNGKGAFPEDDTLAVGVGLSYPAGRDALADCDVVVAVGTEVSQADLDGPELLLGGRVIRIDIDSEQLQKNLSADCVIHADAADAIGHLVGRLEARDRGDGAPRALEARRRLDEEVRDRARAEGLSEAVGAVLSQVRDDTIVVCDTAMLCYNGVIPARFARTPRSCLNPTGFATLGYALPAGIGAQLGRPDRRVLVVTGDGGILFTLAELAMAVDLRLPLPVVVANNRGYGEIRKVMIDQGIEPFGVTFDPPNFPLVAEAFGARGVAVRDGPQLEQAISAAFRADGPTLIEAAFG